MDYTIEVDAVFAADERFPNESDLIARLVLFGSDGSGHKQVEDVIEFDVRYAGRFVTSFICLCEHSHGIVTLDTKGYDTGRARSDHSKIIKIINQKVAERTK